MLSTIERSVSSVALPWLTHLIEEAGSSVR